jgi:uncharacterized membrane protein YjfL (UPF0719 family)
MKTIVLIQVVIAFLIGIGSLFLIFKILNSYMRKQLQIEEKNTAYALFQAGIVIAAAIILTDVVHPALNAINMLNQDGILSLNNVMYSAAYALFFVFIGIFFTFLVIAGGIGTFFQLTKVNEWDEIKNNNIEMSLISVALIIGLSMIVSQYIGFLCEALIPYPTVMQIN